MYIKTVTMKFSIFFSIFLPCLMASTLLYAGSETLTTYYPAPAGNYNKIQTNFMRLGASTLSAIQAQYKCSYNPASGLPACPAGIIYYDTDARTLFFSDGSEWKMAVSSCVPLVACQPNFNCGTDSCGNSCGTCPGNQTCPSPTPGTCG